MEWEIILALVLAIPMMLFPAAYVGYLTIGGALAAAKKEKKAAEGRATAK